MLYIVWRPTFSDLVWWCIFICQLVPFANFFAILITASIYQHRSLPFPGLCLIWEHWYRSNTAYWNVCIHHEYSKIPATFKIIGEVPDFSLHQHFWAVPLLFHVVLLKLSFTNHFFNPSIKVPLPIEPALHQFKPHLLPILEVHFHIVWTVKIL